MKHTIFSVLALSLVGCVASVTPARTGPPPPPPERREAVVHEEPARDHAPPPPHEREPRVIEGVVTDADTHRPIDRAAVDITSEAMSGQFTVQTGTDGRFRTQEIPRGKFGVRCRREGYEVFQQQAVMSDGVAHVDFELHKKR